MTGAELFRADILVLRPEWGPGYDPEWIPGYGTE